MIAVEVRGVAELRRKLDGTPRRIRRRLNKRLRKAARVVRENIRRSIGPNLSGPDRRREGRSPPLGSFSGALRRSLRTFVRVRGRRDWEAKIGPRGKPGFYGWLHEFGLGGYPRRPFVRPGFRRSVRRVRRILRTRLFFARYG